MYLLPSELCESLASMRKVESKASYKRLARLLVFIFFSCICILMWVPWLQTAKGTGRVIAYSPTDRPQNIDAPVEGRLGRWFVQEGTYVKEGDVIVEIQDNDPEIIQRLASEREAIQKRLDAARVASKISKINLDRQRELFNKGLSARRAYEQADLEYARYLTDEANASAELSRIEVRLARQSVQSVKAPRSGTIQRRMAGQESELVKTGEVLAVIVPETDSRAVEVWIDGNDIPLIHETQKVRLQFEGWPAIQFSGWPSVAAGTFGGEVAFMDQADNGVGKFRILVVPTKDEAWPSTRYLRQGVRANAWISLNQVTLGFELWRQFNGFSPALPEERHPQSGLQEKK